MDFKFPYNKDVEHAQEKILKAKSAQEIKDLLKQDDPQKPNYQEGLIRLVTQHIMKQIPQEEITRIENLPSKEGERYREIKKLTSNMDNDLTSSIMLGAALKHNPSMIPRYQREFIEPEKNVGFSVANSTLDYIKSPYLYPNAVEKIFDNVLPKIQQDKQITPPVNTANNPFQIFANSEKEKYGASFSDDKSKEIEIARKAGYVQGVCECVAAIGDDHALGKKLLSEMNVNRDMAKKYANPETFKTLEQGIFAQKPERKQELVQIQGFKI